MNPRSPAFSLIELIVVIAITSLLIGLLVPQLISARRSGRRIQCASNLRQVGVAGSMYRDEFDLMPRAVQDLEQPAWAYVFRPYLTETRDDYYHSVDVYHCPEHRKLNHGIQYVANGIRRGVVGAGGKMLWGPAPPHKPDKFFRQDAPYVTDITDVPSDLHVKMARMTKNERQYAALFIVKSEGDIITDILHGTRQLIGPRKHGSGMNALRVDGGVSFMLTKPAQNPFEWWDGV